ncbi:LOW QUALITY PROTEIN: T-cell surface glycoprotein CD8 alpha chain [Melopsittacus undulatus]|uniref:LOW QUALITY PROTEIN: T-cell surface glycoprotein CD8 alpha chain n=1 Tax=Melopsittacus undulatus TaxID=13146 RepID=UPI00146CCBE0|nr:LOW QUALITY PROTEIN: T-cell surface glycoprotein CD8 alpha chain [Melopsittacus undulatus]
MERVLVTSHPPQRAAQPTQVKQERSSLLHCTKEMMTGAPALLLLLTLGLCCPGIRGQKYTVKIHSTKQPRMGERLMLQCESNNMLSGVFWVHQDKAGTLRFIVFISSLSRTIFGGNSMRTSQHYQAGKDGRFSWLAVNSFTPQDQGTYFCLMNVNQVLYFSPGQPVFLPVTTTVAPKTTPAPTTAAPNITERDPCPRIPDSETSKEKGLDLLCDIFIWVPMTAACFLLLLALAVTIMLCQQTRRRRCRCKRAMFALFTYINPYNQPCAKMFAPKGENHSAELRVAPMGQLGSKCLRKSSHQGQLCSSSTKVTQFWFKQLRQI